MPPWRRSAEASAEASAEIPPEALGGGLAHPALGPRAALAGAAQFCPTARTWRNNVAGEAGFANWQDGWSVDKKAYCCKTESKGCPGSTPPPYDCNAGFEHWEARELILHAFLWRLAASGARNSLKRSKTI